MAWLLIMESMNRGQAARSARFSSGDRSAPSPRIAGQVVLSTNSCHGEPVAGAGDAADEAPS